MKPVTGPKAVVVVGAGIVGISAAYFLARAGADVTVVDAAVPASGATGASDGAVSVTSKRDPYLIGLAQAGVRTYRALAEAGVLADEFQHRPTYVFAGTAEEAGVLERHGAVLRAAGVAVEMLGAGEMARDLAMLAAPPVAAARVPEDGHALGSRIVQRLLGVGGFRVLRNAPVRGFAGSGSRVTGVRTEAGVVDADAVLVAAGSGSVGLLGLEDVVRHRKGQLVITERAPGSAPRPAGPLMSSRYLASKGAGGAGAPPPRTFGLVIDPLRTGQFLIGGTREDDPASTANDHEAVVRILSEAVAVVPSLASLRVLRAFSGVRLATCDRLPIMGPVPGVEGLFVATAFEGDGICLGPMVGQAMQRLIFDEDPEVDLAPLAAGRFDITARFA